MKLPFPRYLLYKRYLSKRWYPDGLLKVGILDLEKKKRICWPCRKVWPRYRNKYGHPWVDLSV